MCIRDRTGTITVHGYRKGEDVYIEVADDGIGMPQEKADAVFSSPPGEIAREPGGYGVKNIIDRLKIAYGYEYGSVSYTHLDVYKRQISTDYTDWG